MVTLPPSGTSYSGSVKLTVACGVSSSSIVPVAVPSVAVAPCRSLSVSVKVSVSSYALSSTSCTVICCDVAPVAKVRVSLVTPVKSLPAVAVPSAVLYVSVTPPAPAAGLRVTSKVIWPASSCAEASLTLTLTLTTGSSWARAAAGKAVMAVAMMSRAMVSAAPAWSMLRRAPRCCLLGAVGFGPFIFPPPGVISVPRPGLGGCFFSVLLCPPV